jgi:hypothetical protein
VSSELLLVAAVSHLPVECVAHAHAAAAICMSAAWLYMLLLPAATARSLERYLQPSDGHGALASVINASFHYSKHAGCKVLTVRLVGCGDQGTLMAFLFTVQGNVAGTHACTCARAG